MTRTAPVRTLAALSLSLFTAAVLAQPAQGIRLRGTIERLAGDTLTVKSRAGDVVAIRLAPEARVTGVVRAALADVTAGKFVGVTSLPRRDGALTALEIHIFPEALRGVGIGHHPWDLEPHSTMTNATVADVVREARDRVLTLRYPGGEKKVYVPESAAIVTFAPADRGALVPGAHVFLFARRAADGTLFAPRVTVGLNGLTPPM